MRSVVHANRPQSTAFLDGKDNCIVEHFDAVSTKLDEYMNAASAVEHTVIGGAAHACTEANGAPASPHPPSGGSRPGPESSLKKG